jgi:hypothetical protein
MTVKSFYQIVKDDAESLQEMTDARRQKEIEKAEKRIQDFWDRSKGDQAKFSAQINLRTKKMTKIEKLQIWKDALESLGKPELSR